ncbi:MAG: DinB family protein [Dehalococcoidia bacterium]|nr:DinB family protein [Dehalococcoidia bacterium]
MHRTEIITLLRQAPDDVEAACRGLSNDQLRRPPQAEGEWSLLEIVCHLRDSAAEEGLRVRRLVEDDNPTLVSYDQDAWAVERNYQGEDPQKALTGLRAFLAGLAYQLEHLPDEAWERSGVHPESGPVTVRSRAEMEVEHARAHLAQMLDVRAAVA